jgi:hypothetical protein
MRAFAERARVKYADALRRISFACRSSRFSRSRAFSRADISVVTPALLPASTSAFFTHSFSECAEQPIFAAIDTIACQREGCSTSCSSTSRTACSRTSGENLFAVLLVIAPSSQELRPPAKPGRFTLSLISSPLAWVRNMGGVGRRGSTMERQGIRD